MVEVVSLTGARLKNKLVARFNVTYQHLVGLGFNGAAAMSGYMSGAQALFRKDVPHAHYVHCFCHRLNLVLSHSVKIDCIAQAHAVVSSIIEFFRSSPKRSNTLSQLITCVPLENITNNKLKSLCETKCCSPWCHWKTCRAVSSHPLCLGAYCNLWGVWHPHTTEGKGNVQEYPFSFICLLSLNPPQGLGPDDTPVTAPAGKLTCKKHN